MKFRKPRKRYAFITLSLSIVLISWVLTDPDLGILKNMPFGSGLISMITTISTCFIGIAILHFTRKAMHDYPPANFYKLGLTASSTSQGAGLFAIAISIMSLAISIIIASVLVS